MGSGETEKRASISILVPEKGDLPKLAEACGDSEAEREVVARIQSQARFGQVSCGVGRADLDRGEMKRLFAAMLRIVPAAQLAGGIDEHAYGEGGCFAMWSMAEEAALHAADIDDREGMEAMRRADLPGYYDTDRTRRWLETVRRYEIDPDAPPRTPRTEAAHRDEDVPEESALIVSDGVVISFTDPDAAECIVPEGVIEVGSKAFAGHKKLERVVLPGSIVTIGYGAFQNCTRLKSVNFPEGLQTIRLCAFMDAGLDEAILPDSLTAMGDMAFANCECLERLRIGSGLREIPYAAFQDCALRTAAIPPTVTDIGEAAFFGNAELRLEVPKGVSAGKDAFGFCGEVIWK